MQQEANKNGTMTTTKLKSTFHLKFVLLILLCSELVNYVHGNGQTEQPTLSDDQGNNYEQIKYLINEARISYQQEK